MDIKEKGTDMWKKIFRKFKNCILIKNKRKRAKER